MENQKVISPLVNLIINKLKKSSIYNGNEKNPNIILFSDNDIFPKPPYVVEIQEPIE